MHAIDWIVVFVYSAISLGLGLAFTKKASEGMESYFASDRSLSWWLAGTSMAATAFSSDTPLLVTGIVRQRGIWGNWEIWALAISTMLAVFFFSKLWKRAGVLTEVEFVELRYSGKPAAVLRGVKALYWGVLYNTFIMGAWPVTGLVKVMQETTDWNKAQAILFCMALTAVYSSLSGFWGVILTDFFQFIVAMAGAVLLAFYAVHEAGGMGHIIEKLQHTDKLLILPPGANSPDIFSTPFGWFLGLIFVQWWAWKNTDGGGVLVQRIASCRNERQAIFAVLWFNIAQYALRSWPWIVTALASLILLPDMTDHERAYPHLIATLMPVGLKGLMIASFFAAFMSTMSTQLNWGCSYFVNDFYKRFVKRDATEEHYVKTARFSSLVLASVAAVIAFFTHSIGNVFTFVLNLTAAIGPVYLLRWFWWRINAWSEIGAMVVSLPLMFARASIIKMLGLPAIPIVELLFMIFASAAFWIPATLLTPPVPENIRRLFYEKVTPPGFWQTQSGEVSWKESLVLWIVSTIALLTLTIGPLQWLLGQKITGGTVTAVSILLWIYVGRKLKTPAQEGSFGR